MVSHRWCLLLFLLVFSALPASRTQAQFGTAPRGVHLSLRADQTEVEVGAQITIEARIDSDERLVNVQEPTLPGLELIARDVSQPSVISIQGFGQDMERSTTILRYVYQASAPGTFEVTPLGVQTDRGRRLTSEGLTVTVGGTPLNRVAAERFDATAFLRVEASNGTPYIGEQIQVTLWLYTQVPVHGTLQFVQSPTTDGLWVIDRSQTNQSEAETRIAHGTRFFAYPLRQFSAFPLRSGEVTIGAAELSFTAGRMLRVEEIRRQGAPLVLHVKDRPSVSTIPAGHIALPGATGTAELTAELDRAQLRTGDAATFQLKIAGTVSTHEIRASLPEVEGLTIHTPVIEDEDNTNGQKVDGKRSIEWLIVADRPGEYELPAFSLPVFDPTTSAWTILSTEPKSLVAVGAPTADALAETDEPRAGSSDAALSVGALRSDTRLLLAAQPVSSRSWFWFALLAAPTVIAVAFVSKTLRNRQPSSRTIATRRVEAHYKAAQACLAKGDARQFYGELSTLLHVAASEKLGEPAIGLRRDQLRSKLTEANLPEDVTNRFLDELDGCDFAQFSSAGASNTEMARTLERAFSLVRNLVIVLLVGLSSTALADTRNDLFARGREAYLEGRYEDAEASWAALRDSGVRDPDVEFDLALAYVGQAKLGHAILHLERSLVLRPGDMEALSALQQVETRLAEVQASSAGSAELSSGGDFLDALSRRVSERTLSFLTLGLAWGFALALVIAMTRKRARDVSAIFAAIFFVLFASAGVALALHRGIARSGHRAVVLTDASLRQAPDERTAELLPLREGRRAIALGEYDEGFAKVRVGDALGWVPEQSVGLIDD